MYVTIDTDSWSETFGQYSVHDGCMSYDGFSSEDEAYAFIDQLLGDE